MSNHEPKEEIYRGVSTLDEPSAKWGWHGISTSAMQKAGWISVIFLLGMTIGNHKGNVENWWLVAIAALIAIGLLLQLFAPQGSQVRTVTGHNKPEGHIEPEWARDQVNGTGVYANLTDSQLRSWNRLPEGQNQ